MAKHLRGKTFAFRVENGYLLENFRVSMLVCRLILPIDKAIIRGKSLVIECKSAKSVKVFPLECFAVYDRFFVAQCQMS